MLYNAYEFSRSWLQGASAIAHIGAAWLHSPLNPFSYTGAGETTAAALDVFSHAASAREKPAFGFTTTERDGRRFPVKEEVIAQHPFGNLVRFARPGAPEGDPRILVVAPMSGHFATLLRGTIERLLPRHDVYVTDWANAKNVPLALGSFDLDDYIARLIDWFALLSPDGQPGLHVLAVCQPAVPVYAATALLAARGSKSVPATLTLMGGPIDTRKGVTQVNRFAEARSLSWFEQNLIFPVPPQYPGYERHVYPGFLQLSGFMSMNFGNHLMSHWKMFKELVRGDEESADATRAFYEEYRSVADLPAEFYLQTVDTVFQRHLLPKGEMQHHGEPVDPRAISKTAILAIEGEFDDISGRGQTEAALTLATNLPDSRKEFFLAEGVGHYGIFNGRRWREVIAPVIERFVRAHPTAGTTTAAATAPAAARTAPATTTTARPAKPAAQPAAAKAAPAASPAAIEATPIKAAPEAVPAAAAPARATAPAPKIAPQAAAAPASPETAPRPPVTAPAAVASATGTATKTAATPAPAAKATAPAPRPAPPPAPAAASTAAPDTAKPAPVTQTAVETAAEATASKPATTTSPASPATPARAAKDKPRHASRAPSRRGRGRK